MEERILGPLVDVNEGGGGSQADCGRLGGATIPTLTNYEQHDLDMENIMTRPHEGELKCYQNTVRVELVNEHQRKKVNHETIHNSFISKFGKGSEQVKQIVAICRGSNEFIWFVNYKRIPDNTVSNHTTTVRLPFVLINEIKAYLYDASEFNQLQAPEKKSDVKEDIFLHFRVHGLPADVKRVEVHDSMTLLGLDIEYETDIRQVYIKNTPIRTEMVDIKVNRVSRDGEDQVTAQTSIIGEHKVIIGEYNYPIKVICFGFCNICKELGHNAFDCPVRKENIERRLLGVRCHLCTKQGHYSKICPDREKLLSEKKATVCCHKCRQMGHYNSECTMSGPPKWEANKLVSRKEMLEFVDRQNALAENEELEDNNTLKNFNYTKKPSSSNNVANNNNNNNNKTNVTTILVAHNNHGSISQIPTSPLINDNITVASTPNKDESEKTSNDHMNNMMENLDKADDDLKRNRDELSKSSASNEFNNKLLKLDNKAVDDESSKSFNSTMNDAESISNKE